MDFILTYIDLLLVLSLLVLHPKEWIRLDHLKRILYVKLFIKLERIFITYMDSIISGGRLIKQ